MPYRVLRWKAVEAVSCLLFPTQTFHIHRKWPLETCYPFIEKDEHKAKKTSSKALVMTHAYSNVIMDKIEEAVKNGLAGNESDNW